MLVYGAVQPETKQALAKLAQWFPGCINWFPSSLQARNQGGYYAIFPLLQ